MTTSRDESREVAAAARSVLADAMAKESSPSVEQLAALAAKRRPVDYVPALVREALAGVECEDVYAFWLTEAKVAPVWPVSLGGDQAVRAARVLAEPIADRLAELEDDAGVWEEDGFGDGDDFQDDYPEELDAPYSVVDEEGI